MKMIGGRLINDFAAQALACPILGPDALKPLGPVMRGDADGPMVVLGAGTGFGVAGLAANHRRLALASLLW